MVKILTDKAIRDIIYIEKQVKKGINMDIDQKKSIIEAILFAAGREVTKKELMLALEISPAYDHLNAGVPHSSHKKPENIVVPKEQHLPKKEEKKKEDENKQKK